MWSIVFFSLIVCVTGHNFGCPTNVTCIAKETCCETGTGLWACCPIEDGLCCDDGVHCCAKGHKCLPEGNCSSPTNQYSIAISLRMQSVQCEDGSVCPDGNTCCELASGQYGCCPIVDAVCCSDHIHCCPNGYKCDVEHSKCKKELNDVPCPGGSSACPDGETCCILQSGDYGCCPLSDAVCCSDHIHCCPHGYTCDVEKGQCLRQNSIPWLTKTPSHRRQYEKLTNVFVNEDKNAIKLNIGSDIICPDATSLCPSTSTCCLSSESIWGCCPIENAVCCSDHKHCCPEHYKCDLHVFQCDHSSFQSISLFETQKCLNSISTKLILSNSQFSLLTIRCPDSKSFCPEETTCCELANGDYGCCPYPQASCCSDKIHCCANGYSCDKTGKRCSRHFISMNKTDIISSVLKLKSLKSKISIKKQNLVPLLSGKDELCPDGKSKCPSSSTCCPNEEKDEITYSCCPYSKGVCCGSNGSICCPNHYTCDEKQLSCQLTNSKSVRSISSESDYRQCGTSNVACSVDQTCCTTYGSSDGQFACCAFANAQCCEDGRHCCPQGTTCDIQSGGCLPKYSN